MISLSTFLLLAYISSVTLGANVSTNHTKIVNAPSPFSSAPINFEYSGHQGLVGPVYGFVGHSNQHNNYGYNSHVYNHLGYNIPGYNYPGYLNPGYNYHGFNNPVY